MQSCRLIIQHLAVPRRPLEQPPAEAGGLCGGGIDADRCSFLLSVSERVICSRPSLNHPFTHSPTHSFSGSHPHSRTAAARQAVSPTSPSKTATLPPFGQTNLSPGQDDVPLEKRPHRTISDTHPVSLIHKSSLGEKKEFFYREAADKG